MKKDIDALIAEERAEIIGKYEKVRFLVNLMNCLAQGFLLIVYRNQEPLLPTLVGYSDNIPSRQGQHLTT